MVPPNVNDLVLRCRPIQFSSIFTAFRLSKAHTVRGTQEKIWILSWAYQSLRKLTSIFYCTFQCCMTAHPENWRMLLLAFSFQQTTYRMLSGLPKNDDILNFFNKLIALSERLANIFWVLESIYQTKLSATSKLVQFLKFLRPSNRSCVLAVFSSLHLYFLQ